jgi:hypothetical protein
MSLSAGQPLNCTTGSRPAASTPETRRARSIAAKSASIVSVGSFSW